VIQLQPMRTDVLIEERPEVVDRYRSRTLAVVKRGKEHRMEEIGRAAKPSFPRMTDIRRQQFQLID
jgi:hypothetical protein